MAYNCQADKELDRLTESIFNHESLKNLFAMSLNFKLRDDNDPNFDL